MLDVSRWLAEHGLGQHAKAFADNGIAGDVVRDLTDADLKELGLNLGDRKRLLKAIAGLHAAQDPAEAAGQAATPAAPREAERRQLTVMLVDLVGSTALAQSLDPEEMREVLRSYQNAVAGEITRYEGHVAKFMGDGVLAYFGWPQAHEDEAERAVRAGLAITAAVANLEVPTGDPLAARVGIATGLVVVGDLVGDDEARERAVVGETPNLAARLQTLAAPGNVVIGHSTRRLVGGLFELIDLGPQRVKGFTEPLAVWRVSGEGRAEGRFEARQMTGLTPLVGREEEISLLLRRWRQASDGEGQVVLLSGEPGIGKSRIVRELRARLEGEPHVRLLCQCSPHHATSPLHPVIEQVERAAGFERDDTAGQKLDRLEALLARSTDRGDQAVPLIAALLGITPEDRYPPLDLTPQRQKQRTLDVLVDELDGLSAEQPVLLIYEDAHWIDPTTLELLGLAVERIQRLAVLAIVTFRTEFSAPWAGLPHVSSLPLTRLGRRDGVAMLERVVGKKSLPPEVSAQIVAKTDGVPLFVEELTKTVLESGLLQDAGDSYELAGPLPPLAIPSTLHDSLLARLDRLAPVKEIAQVGAAIGREFSYAVLAAVADRPEAELRASLDQLVASELVFRRGSPPNDVYAFKHALVQDAAYGTLLRSRRQHLHARVAQVMQEKVPEIVATQPELVAHHFSEAGLVDQAVNYWWLAGKAAAAHSAPAEACGHLRKALDLLTQLPDTDDRARLELELLTAFGGALMAGTAGYASPETAQTWNRARELCGRLVKTDSVFPLMFGQWAVHLTRGELRAASELADEALDLADRDGDERGLAVAQRLVGVTALWGGRPELARSNLEKALALHEPARDEQHLAHLYAWDQRAAALVCLAVALWQLGYPEQALARSREALRQARQLSHTATLAHTLSHCCVVHELLRDTAGVSEQAEALESLCTEQRLHFPLWIAMARFFRGVKSVASHPDEGFALMVRALREYEASGSRLYLPYWLSLLAKAFADADRHVDAQAALQEAEEWVSKTEQG